MSKLKLGRKMNQITGYVCYAILALLAPFIAADMVVGNTNWWPFMIMIGFVYVAMAQSMFRKAKEFEEYERLGREALQASPNLTDLELAAAILSMKEGPDRGKV